MSIFSAIDELITEHGSAKILRERLLQIREEGELLLKENVNLKQELSSAKAEIAELIAKVKAYATAEEFVPYGMALFKRKGKGTYADSVFCPRCSHILSTSTMTRCYKCIPCNHTSEIEQGKIPAAIAELIRRDEIAAKENP